MVKSAGEIRSMAKELNADPSCRMNAPCQSKLQRLGIEASALQNQDRLDKSTAELKK